MIKENKITNILFYFTILAIILIGIYIRASFYFAKYPLWLDEIMLGYNFCDRSILESFAPLDAYQKAPQLFSLIVLIIRKIFGLNELSLRFIPFISGILSLFAYFILLKQNIKNKAGIIAGLFLFTFCVPLIYFCAEFKQYSSDVLFCILLFLIYKKISFKNIGNKKYYYTL